MFRTAILGAILAGCGAQQGPRYFYSGGRVHAFTYEEDGIRFEGGATARLTRRIVVGIDDGRGIAELAAQPGLIAAAKGGFSERVHLASFASEAAAVAAANALHGRPGVRFAHPDFALALEARQGSDPMAEPYYERSWHLPRTQTPAAWSVTRGSPATLVALIDLGFEQSHPDLAPAWYRNPGEVAGNRHDDDGNGQIDDVSGWNFAINGPNLIYGMNPAHGTASAGVIGARADGRGTAGICPLCQVLPLVVDEAPSNAAAAFHYAARAGATVISNSWGYAVGTPQTDVLVEAIREVATNGRGGKGTTIVFAMDNSDRDNCRGPEPDISSLDTVVAVSAADRDDRKIESSGHGPCLDFVAPSAAAARDAIATVDRPGEKGFNKGDNAEDFADLAYTSTFYGTSAATPQVAAGFALLYDVHPELTRAEALQRMIDAADKVRPQEAAYDPTSGHSRLYGHGRINLGRLLAPP